MKKYEWRQNHVPQDDLVIPFLEQAQDWGWEIFSIYKSTGPLGEDRTTVVSRKAKTATKGKKASALDDI